MLVEAEAIPYEPAPLLGERLLVLAPHPDDEVIACGGLIARHLRAGRAVRVVVVTDGTKATGAGTDAGAYRDQREQESRRGVTLLGDNAQIHFLRIPDRALDDSVCPAIRNHLVEFRPDLVCIPSAVEIHPDHLALSRAFSLLIQRDETLFADLASARVAFYEVSQPLRPNALVDITDVAEAKYAAIAAHESQTALKDYVAYARGLNAYRAMTLPAGVKAAEAYRVMPLPELRTTPFSELQRAAGPATTIEVLRPEVPITVIVRTKDRPALLRDAIASVRQSGYPAHVIVVNDGGTRPQVDATIIEHAESRGRSEAMNSGVRAATTSHLAFLDDDDLFYPEHLPTLAAAANTASDKAGWYTDAVSAFVALGPSGSWETRSRQRLFAQDFDRDSLLVDNFIPLTTLLVRREDFLEVGGFDPAFDLFEDWDFLIRLTGRGELVRIPRLTCEVRHVEGGGSITLAAPEGSQRFRDAKLQVWARHAEQITPDVFGRAWEKQKRRLQASAGALIEEAGRRGRAGNDIARLEREKSELLGQLGALHEARNENLMYIVRLEESIASYRSEAAAAGQAAMTAGQEAANLREVLDSTEATLRSSTTEIQRLQGEIQRLQGLLDMIFRSRTWKMHSFLDRIRGRG